MCPKAQAYMARETSDKKAERSGGKKSLFEDVATTLGHLATPRSRCRALKIVQGASQKVYKERFARATQGTTEGEIWIGLLLYVLVVSTAVEEEEEEEEEEEGSGSKTWDEWANPAVLEYLEAKMTGRGIVSPDNQEDWSISLFVVGMDSIGSEEWDDAAEPDFSSRELFHESVREDKHELHGSNCLLQV